MDTQARGERQRRRSCSRMYCFGHLRHGAAYRKWLALWERHGWLRAFFERQANDGWRVQPRWPEGAVGGPRLSRQYARFIRRAGQDSLVFLQVGKFVESYGPQRLHAARTLRLVRVAIARGGFVGMRRWRRLLQALVLGDVAQANASMVSLFDGN